MYTNGFTGQKYLSLIAVTNCAGYSANILPLGPTFTGVLTDREFAALSEHVTLETDECGYTLAKCDMAGEIGNPADVFTGV